MRAIHVYEHKWSDDYSYLRYLTCSRHPSNEYRTKNPWDRSVHIMGAGTDCDCPLGDLVVWVKEDGDDHLTADEYRSRNNPQ